MKAKDVQIGMKCFTKIGQQRQEVVVVEEVTPTFFNKKTTYRVRRIDENKPLPSTRAASALHLTRR